MRLVLNKCGNHLHYFQQIPMQENYNIVLTTLTALLGAFGGILQRQLKLKYVCRSSSAHPQQNVAACHLSNANRFIQIKWWATDQFRDICFLHRFDIITQNIEIYQCINVESQERVRLQLILFVHLLNLKTVLSEVWCVQLVSLMLEPPCSFIDHIDSQAV